MKNAGPQLKTSGRQDLNLRPLDPQPLPAGFVRNPGTPIFLHHNASRANVQTFDPLTLFMHRLHVYWVNSRGVIYPTALTTVVAIGTGDL